MQENKIQAPGMTGITEVESTNKFLEDEIYKRQLPTGYLVYAEIQTYGRGHAGNTWESEPYKNLLFSVYFKPADVPASRLFVISEMASLSVKYMLDKYILDVTVKWPNDVYYRDWKISGILINNVIMGEKVEHSIIGTGININQLQFLSDAPNPVSLSQITGVHHDKIKILNEFRAIFTEQSRRLNSNCFDEIHNEYLHAIYRREGCHKYVDANGVFEAKIYDVEPAGNLVLERTDGRLSKYAYKEVAWL